VSRYIDLSGGLGKKLANLAAAKHKVEAVAEDLAKEIKRQMEEAPPRSGHEYPMPGSTSGQTYTASAPGEPPAIRLGHYRDAWAATPAVVRGDKVMAFAVNDRKTEDEEHFIGEILEYGSTRYTDPAPDSMIVPTTVHVAPRPHIRPAMEEVAARWPGAVIRGPGE
jgi:hypothetical protein